jgi:hypothetical protein
MMIVNLKFCITGFDRGVPPDSLADHPGTHPLATARQCLFREMLKNPPHSRVRSVELFPVLESCPVVKHAEL